MRGIRSWVGVLAVLAAAGVIWVVPANAATITVTATADDADLAADNGICTLREAVRRANSNGTEAPDCVFDTTQPFGGDTINLVAGTYTLDETTDGDLDVTGDTANELAIEGAGAAATTITTAPGWSDRVFDHSLAGDLGTLTLSDLSVSGGNVADLGGGIRALAGGLVLDRVRVTNNSAAAAGGVQASGSSVEITDSLIDRNTAVNNGGGVSLAVSSSAGTVEKTLFTLNSVANSDGTPAGGAAFVSPAPGETFTISDSLVLDNDALDLDGGIGQPLAGGLQLALTTGSTVNVRGTSVIDNETREGGGTPGPDGDGGAFRIDGTGTVNVVNSTVSGNSAVNAGGFDILNGTVNLVHTTVGPNPASTNASAVRRVNPSAVNLRGSLIEAIGAAACDGTLTSGGHNVIVDSSCLAASTTGDETGTDPMINALANNGGPGAGPPGLVEPITTHLPMAGSTAIDDVPVAACTDLPSGSLSHDQRGLFRPQDGDGNGVADCESGSVELQPPPAPQPPASTAAGENPECPVLRAKLAKLNKRIKQAGDPEKKAKLKQKRRKLRARMRDLGCAT